MSKHTYWWKLRFLIGTLSFLVAVLAFTGVFPPAALGMRIHFGPSLLHCAAAFQVGALCVVLFWLVFAFVLGRFYCGWICPLGILQDIIIWFGRRRSSPAKDLAVLRSLLAGVAYGMLCFGSVQLFLFLEPYSNFGRICASFSIGGLIPLLVLIGLAVWKQRLFCTALCPVGALLGLISRKSLWRMEISKDCLHCGKCVRKCPAGCIDLVKGVVDNERCVRCLACVDACEAGAMRFLRAGKANPEEVPNGLSRRQFLQRGMALVAGVAASPLLLKMCKGLASREDEDFMPPGADSSFRDKCTACQLCVANCPGGVLVPARGGDGPVRLDFSHGSCRYDCNRCGNVCPTGALHPLPLAEKRKTRLALAKINFKECVVFQKKEECGRCAQACPVHAISLFKSGAPRQVRADACIGCGACHEVCPSGACGMSPLAEK